MMGAPYPIPDAALDEDIAVLGRKVDGIETPPTAGDGLARWWGAKLGVRRLMDALIETYPAPVGRLALAEAVGMTASGGTFGSYMSRLRSNGMIEETADGIRISTHLMEQRS